MSRPRFLADEDLRGALVAATQRLDPTIDFATIPQLGLSGEPDETVLERAATHGRIVVSHDRKTMTAAARNRLLRGDEIPGLLIVPQSAPTRLIAEHLALIAGASDAEEWQNVIEFIPW